LRKSGLADFFSIAEKIIPDLRDIRIKDGILAEPWDVIQHEATKEQSKNGNPMFGTAFPV
jgi:hypothetical protein